LHFVLAAKYEEIVAISWNPAEGKVMTIKYLGVSSLIITRVSKILNTIGALRILQGTFFWILIPLVGNFIVSRTIKE
jgi:hypothetical protein